MERKERTGGWRKERKEDKREELEPKEGRKEERKRVGCIKLKRCSCCILAPVTSFRGCAGAICETIDRKSKVCHAIMGALDVH